jgi:protein SERAC1
VFVHGLNGDMRKTWTDDELFWPKTLLPDDVPKARILTFGYNASIVHFWGYLVPSESRIFNHADDLIASLVGLRDQSKTVSLARQ